MSSGTSFNTKQHAPHESGPRQGQMRAAVLGLIVAGCAPLGWDKPGASDADFRGDLAECHKGEHLIYQQARTFPTLPGTDLARGGTEPSDAGLLGTHLSNCLNAKGWKQVSRQRRSGGAG